MSDPTFNIVFSGQLVAGSDPARVKENLARLFKMDAAKVEALFSGNPVVIKKGADQATAMKFRAALRQAGAQCDMVEVGAEPAAAAAPAPAPSASRAVFDSPEPTPPPAQARAVFAARDIEPAAPMENVEEVQPAPPPSVAPAAPAPVSRAAGSGQEMVGTIRTGGTAFSGPFDVAPVGTDMADAAAEVAAVNPDISHLSMAPVGADLEQIKDTRKTTVPDLSHLSVKPLE